MKNTCLWLLLLLPACTTPETRNEQTATAPADTSTAMRSTATAADGHAPSAEVDRTYNNERFREVRVTKTGDHRYRITGQAQVFEAAFSWVIEDGHNELQQGHEMTDAGAPAWGNFDFTVEAKKQRENSTLHLVLFEVSAKDGSRVHELPVPLE